MARDWELKERWRQAGGTWHGPNVEHGTMEEGRLLIFLRGLYDEIDSLYRQAEELRFPEPGKPRADR